VAVVVAVAWGVTLEAPKPIAMNFKKVDQRCHLLLLPAALVHSTKDRVQKDIQEVVTAAPAADNTVINLQTWAWVGVLLPLRWPEVAEVDNTPPPLRQWEKEEDNTRQHQGEWEGVTNHQWDNHRWDKDSHHWDSHRWDNQGEDNLQWEDSLQWDNPQWEGVDNPQRQAQVINRHQWEEADSPDRRRPHPDVPQEIHPDVPQEVVHPDIPQEVPHPDIPRREIPHPEIPQKLPPQDIPRDVPEEVPQEVPRREVLMSV